MRHHRGTGVAGIGVRSGDLGRAWARATLPVLLAGLAVLSLLGGGSLAAPVASAPTITYHPVVANIISQITTPTLAYELAGLTGERPVVVGGEPYTITTRNSEMHPEIEMATEYVYEQFQSYGLDVTFQDYSHYCCGTLRNVIAEKPGAVEPDEIYLIVAHLDDMPRTLFAPAPGADDNGSGSVAVLTAARLLAPHRFVHTIRFVLFTGEEQGLLGSEVYAGELVSRGEDVRGVVNLDMIAYESDGVPIFDLYASPDVSGSVAAARVFYDVTTVYDLPVEPNLFVVSGGFPMENSDHWSFLEHGLPAFMACEDVDDFTIYMHTPNDRLSTLDLDHYAGMTRAAVATIAHLAEPFYEVHLPWVASSARP